MTDLLSNESRDQLQQMQTDVVRLDANVKQIIQKIVYVKLPESVEDDRNLLIEQKEAKQSLDLLRETIGVLTSLVPTVKNRLEQTQLKLQIEDYEKELSQNALQLKSAVNSARKRISDAQRRMLFDEGIEGASELRRRTGDRIREADQAKATDRLTALVSQMGGQVNQSEKTMDSLIHSSAVLAQTQGEFESQGQHIQANFFTFIKSTGNFYFTGGKLLSKYERRELTDKILVAIALIVYLAVMFYILQKRVLTRFWLW
ncbi:hypothetical protein WR25_12967 [Diploscapter pachys]|uniref:Sec20 C-terminal domain-containing protein n=1 Tax=Diploscapter pachys TaxID=2018661 RepID=A0A2A2K326_9BILA|nr:hypothetical protein WR25_12967 [Diploscapter pachys]